MDPTYLNKKILDLTDDELIFLGFKGENVIPDVEDIIDRIKASPENLGFVTCFAVDCLRRNAISPASSNISPAISDPETLVSQGSDKSNTLTLNAPDLISDFEAVHWYHGISGDPPKLLWRSDIETNPFPTPPPGAKFFTIPTKTAHGVFNTPLNEVWEDVAPLILQTLKTHGLRYSSLNAARFSTTTNSVADSLTKVETFGPVVIWIAIYPNTATAATVRDATPDVLQILADVQITDVTVEWYEGSVVKLAGPPLMKIEHTTNPKAGLNHPFNIGLGIPIARMSDDTQGTLALLFREVKTSSGDPSDRVLGITNKHVASVDTTVDDDGSDSTQPHCFVVCGDRQLAEAIKEIESMVSTKISDATEATEMLKDLKSKVGTPAEDQTALRRTYNILNEAREDCVTLRNFFDQVKTNWTETNRRKIGDLDWAPMISVRLDDHHYTRDLATIALDLEKFGEFKRNIIDLGSQYTATELGNLFWPIAATRKGRRIPANLQLPIHRALSRQQINSIINAGLDEVNRKPAFVVAKYGSNTKLTLGHFAGLEAYTCDELGVESREVAVYNYSKTCGNFSSHGDSGSLIFTGDGDGLAILHSGMPRGMDDHITYATPLWWVIKQILTKYPFAEFCGIAYDLD